jgi:hypothetical protein
LRATHFTFIFTDPGVIGTVEQGDERCLVHEVERVAVNACFAPEAR